MELSDFPIIIDETSLYYGGSQEWYRKKWHAEAGCAATAASNLAAFYHIGISPILNASKPNTFDKGYFLRLMNLMFTYITPHFLGFPNYRKFARKFLRYVKQHGKEAIAHLLGQWSTYEEVISFLKEALEHDNPVALLILTHQDKQFEENTWHWMTVTGIEENRIILSNYGQRESYAAEDLFRKDRKNRIHLVWFEIKKDA